MISWAHADKTRSSSRKRWKIDAVYVYVEKNYQKWKASFEEGGQSYADSHVCEVICE